MANVDRPMGFVWARSDAGHNSPVVRKYEAADRSADTTNNHGDIYIGDPVTFSSGKLIVCNSGANPAGVVHSVGQGGEMGNEKNASFNPADLTMKYLPHTVTSGAFVGMIPAAGNLFRIQSAADLDLAEGATADISIDATEAHGDRTTGQSNCELVASANTDVVVEEVLDEPENDGTLANATYIVRLITTQNPA